ncbi:MAG: GNAT family N-acetyltransferase [Candidatus Cloacimonetes bacterium]|nr:GNAT family N-acetyltransferase [Candidatus Cloacimonadota bacterium]
MNLIITDTLPDSEEFFHLFETTGWNKDYRVNPEELFLVLKNSWFCLSGYLDNRLIGFGRIVSDGLLHAMIYDMIIHPDYQGYGYGALILKKLLEKCQSHRIRDIQLFSARNKMGFYKRFGFTTRPAEAQGMEIKYRISENKEQL